jgi:ketosteroid isomerase-like protein
LTQLEISAMDTEQIEQNKQLAAAFCERFSANDIDGVLALLSEDATDWIAGKPDGPVPVVGTQSKAQIGRIFRRMAEASTGGLQMQVRSLLAEGERVAMEASSRCELKNGRVYAQEYHLLMTMRDGRISAVREYLDTLHVHRVWFAG